jgi:hypothetical protein
MDWRVWVYDRLRLDATILADVPDSSIYGPGSLTGSPAKRPFIVISFGTELPEMNDADTPSVTSQRVTIQVHDTPGDFLRIARILRNIRTLLAGNVTGMASGGIIGLWEGDSADLADDLFKTIMRYGEYRFVGKVG